MTTPGSPLTTALPEASEYQAHRARGPLNALFFAGLDGYLDRQLRTHKKRIFTDLPPTVVELGSGTGANLRYLPAGTRLVAVEPNPAMHRLLRKRATRAQVDLELHTTVGEHLDLPDAAADMVISSLVLCTVPDPGAVLAEVRRVLRPGGRYAFLEHVAAPEHSALRRLQRAVRRPWGWFFEGCSCERDLRTVIENAGFTRAAITDYRLRGPFLPASTQIAGVATAGE